MYKRIAGLLMGLLAAWMLLPGGDTGCTVTVRCPGGPAATTYYYDLVGEGYLETIAVDYSPGTSGSDVASIRGVPAGVYRLLEDGVERARFTLTPGTGEVRIEPEADWPIMPPSGKE